MQKSSESYKDRANKVELIDKQFLDWPLSKPALILLLLAMAQT